MEERIYHCVGLGGDGDEIAAIQDVEQEFGVVLDKQDAAHWWTAGDVFASLMNVIPSSVASEPTIWDRFTEALSGQTGIDPNLITKDSPLILPRSVFWARVEAVWAVLAWSFIALLLGAFLVAHLTNL